MNSNPSEVVLQEIERWDKGHIEIETMATRLKEAETKCEILKDKVKILEKRIKVCLSHFFLFPLSNCTSVADSARRKRCPGVFGTVPQRKM